MRIFYLSFSALRSLFLDSVIKFGVVYISCIWLSNKDLASFGVLAAAIHSTSSA